jgi:N-acetylneuraminic acid mutarotase
MQNSMKKKLLKVTLCLPLLFCGLDLFAQVFQTTTSFTDARHGHCTAQSIDDKVLIFGGIVANGSNINSVYEYDPVINLWSSKASIPNASGLSKSTCVKLNNGKILLFGGSQNGSTPQSNKVYQYDIATNSWIILSDLPNALGREQMQATLMNDTIILLTGGISTISSALEYPTTNYLYNTNTNTFSIAGNLPFGLINQTSTLLSNGEVLITGGFDGNQARSEVYVFNLQNGWRTLSSSLSVPVSSHRAVLVNGKVYIYGGFNIPLFEFSDKLDVYDSAQDAVSPLTTGPLASSQFAMVSFNSTILIAGGSRILPNSSFGVTNEAYLYNINNNTFTTVVNMPSIRGGMGISELGNTGKFIFSGGHVSLSEPFDDGIIYDAALLSGIEENNILNSFDLYPNPCQNELNLRINSSEFLSKYEVFNSLGQMIQSGMIEFSNSTINTSDFPQGCYMISIHGIAYQRFQVVR